MEIKEAKRELVSKLQNKHRGIIGGGIRQKDGEPVIVVFVTTTEQQNVVPPYYEGNKVEAEVKGYARAWSWPDDSFSLVMMILIWIMKPQSLHGNRFSTPR
ncbi:MAG TPA: hypothetical protein VMR70_18460 [Flavisolibacter sp.]|nr:hypothetical protein [Flavisolibacter sp.]